MYVQIDNAGFVNKGAALMIFSIIDYLRQRIPNIKFVMGNGWSPDKIDERRAGLYQIAEFEKVNSNDITEVELEKYGLVRRESVDVILDAGGFQYGDCWMRFYSEEANKKLRAYYEDYKSRGVKVVLLPQAFGPFTEELACERMKIVHEYVDMIYAREKTSFNYLRDLLGESSTVKMAPDFTSLLDTSLRVESMSDVRGSICLVPNQKMIEMKEEKSQYLPYLESLIKFFLDKNERVVLLNHEGPSDLKIIDEIISKFDKDGSIRALDFCYAPVIKAALGQCKMIISSRYHGAISGISQGVPTFCTSWSHKYQEMLEDYELTDNLLDVMSLGDSMEKLERCLANPDEFTASPEAIKRNKDLSEAMWQEILSSILAVAV